MMLPMLPINSHLFTNLRLDVTFTKDIGTSLSEVFKTVLNSAPRSKHLLLTLLLGYLTVTLLYPVRVQQT